MAQAEANVFYPAVTQAELDSDAQLLSGYRRTMGRERIAWAAAAFAAGAWVVQYLRKG